MNKIKNIIGILLAVPFLFFSSCEKLEVPTNEEPQPVTIEEDSIPIYVAPSDNPDSLSLEDIIEYVEHHGLTEENAYSVNDVLYIIPQYLEYHGAIGIHNAYVGGFIVGYTTKNNISHTVFSYGNVETNIVIADSTDEIDYHNCIAIQLSMNTNRQKEVRAGLNLVAHPENIGRYVILRGHITKYMGTFGLKSVNDAIIYTE